MERFLISISVFFLFSGCFQGGNSSDKVEVSSDKQPSSNTGDSSENIAVEPNNGPVEPVFGSGELFDREVLAISTELNASQYKLSESDLDELLHEVELSSDMKFLLTGKQ